MAGLTSTPADISFSTIAVKAVNMVIPFTVTTEDNRYPNGFLLINKIPAKNAVGTIKAKSIA